MTGKGHLLFLGTGGSLGVPVVGCSCHVCKSDSPYNKRLRPSALLEIEGKRYLIDCGPDFRLQALNNNITSLDGVILTHAHHDHCAGIDELRIFTFKKGSTIPCMMSSATYEDLKRRYDYIFADNKGEMKFTTNFSPIIFPNNSGAIDFNGLKISYCTYEQAGMKVNGLRLGNLAFLTDLKDFDETIFNFAQGVDTLIINALRFTPSPFHLSIDEAIDFSKRMGAHRTWFTHIAHDLDHEAGNAYLPSNIRLAYDGLQISFNPEKV